MAKKKVMELAAIPSLYDSEKVYDNRHPGVMDLPNDSLIGCRYPKGKMQMVEAVGKGEGKYRPDTLTQTADGSARSKGQNPGQQSNWDPSSAWSESKDWDGSNLTGM